MKRLSLILALTVSLITPLVSQPIARAAYPQGPKATAAQPAVTRPAADIPSQVLSNGLEVTAGLAQYFAKNPPR